MEDSHDKDRSQNEKKDPRENPPGSYSEEDAKRALMNAGKSQEEESGRESDQQAEQNSPTGSGVRDLGKVETPEEAHAKKQEEYRKQAMDIGFKNMPFKSLPSLGKYYPPDMKLSFRAASLEEVKHYSSMQEEDLMDIEDKLSYILGTCIRVTYSDRRGSYQDLKDFDKIYMLFAIRDFTATKHHRENKIYQHHTCSSCGEPVKMEITNDVFGYYDIPNAIMRYYDEQERCVKLIHDSFGEVKIYIPSIGVTKRIKKYIYDKTLEKKRGQGDGFFDKEFLKILQFLVPDWRSLNNDYIEQSYRKYKGEWNYDKYQTVKKVADNLNVGIKPTVDVRCKCGNTDNTTVVFKGGFQSIMELKSAADDLFEGEL